MNMTLHERRITSMKKVLIVEDVDFNRDLVVQLLEDKYHVIEAVNGQEGLELAERERPELILMDLSLPVIDGWEATRRLKANDDLRSIPVIALTAHAMKGDEEKALAAGCDDYLVKPLDEDELMVRIAKYLE
jgi:CheY-like chemotaxis protein